MGNNYIWGKFADDRTKFLIMLDYGGVKKVLVINKGIWKDRMVVGFINNSIKTWEVAWSIKAIILGKAGITIYDEESIALEFNKTSSLMEVHQIVIYH